MSPQWLIFIVWTVMDLVAVALGLKDRAQVAHDGFLMFMFAGTVSWIGRRR